MNKIIYLDNNATTPIDPRVLEAMMPFLTNNFANANSTHQFGISTFEAVKKARLQIAELIGAETDEIIFTSGATESINLAIKGIAENYSHKGKHIITVSTEHHAVLDTCKYLETRGYDVTYLPVNPDGLIDLNVFRNSLRTDTILACVMYVNNETGVIQAIKELAELTHERGALFMTDGTQAVGKIPLYVDELDIDLLCFSGHKLYAPKGIGALFIKQRRNKIKLSALLHGGGHEKGLRSGTLNVPGIIALGTACMIAQNEMKQDEQRISILRNNLEDELLKVSNTFINGSNNKRIYNVSNICFPGTDANALIGRMKNVAASNGSACTAAIIEPSHVLKAMGLSDEEAFSSVRFSLGKFNNNYDIIMCLNEIKKIIIGVI